MNRIIFLIFSGAAIVILVGVFSIYSGSPSLVRQGWESFLAFVLPQTASSSELRSRYTAGTLKVLVAPGHDSLYWGASCNGVNEADLNLELAGYLIELLSNDGNIATLTTRDIRTGGYVPELADYFINQKEAIAEFRNRAKRLMDNLVQGGILDVKPTENHGFATKEIADVLYGINKWADEKGADLTLHLHFNDAPGNRRRSFRGFSVYVPEAQYSNAAVSKDVARAIAASFSEYFAPSNHRFERDVVVEDQDLIAVGANATRKKAAILIENSYLCEPQFTNPALRPALLRELAFRTYQGLRAFLAGDEVERYQYETSILPHEWTGSERLVRGARPNLDVLALQTALRRDGFYPPPGKDLGECPLTGLFGPCTGSAVNLFQREHKLRETSGNIGPLTLQKLNERFSQ